MTSFVTDIQVPVPRQHADDARPTIGLYRSPSLVQGSLWGASPRQGATSLSFRTAKRLCGTVSMP